MKRIEFIAPVEAVRGNLSGSQDLKYAKRDNPAWDAPDGVQAAKNYTPRFVGAKRSKDGLKYFSVRKSGVVNINTKSRETMALLACSATCFLAASKTLAILSQLQIAFVAAKASDPSLTWRKWLQGILYEMLANKQGYAAVSYVSPSTGTTETIKIGNPWVAPGAGVTGVTPLTISTSILVKFWTQMAVDGFNFTIVAAGGLRVKGIAYSGLNWETLTEDAEKNVLGLYIDHDDSDALKYKGLYVLNKDGEGIIDTASDIEQAEYPVSSRV